LNLNTELWQQRIVEDHTSRAIEYRRAWEAYFGKYKKALKVRAGAIDDNVVVNFARVVVDKSVSFLFGDEPRFELDETAQTDAEGWLGECWRENHKMQLLQKIALNGSVCGHVFVKLLPREPYPKLVNLSPEYVRVITDPEDIDEVVRFVIEYPALGADGQQLTYRQTIENEGNGWVIRDEMARGDGPFVLRDETGWPWAWPPIVHCQNLPSPNEFYGISDIEDDVIDLNYSINFVLSNLARIIRHHAHPKTWGTGFNVKDMKIAVDETIVLPQNGQLHNLEMESDLASSIELYKRLREALHEIARVPEVATGKVDDIGALSGVALQILYQPLIEKTETKRRTYGEMLVEINQRLLEVGGFGADNITTIHWPELLPRDMMQERQAALIDQQLGVSDDTLLQKLGYDAELEKEKREATSAELGEQMLTAFERGEM